MPRAPAGKADPSDVLENSSERDRYSSDRHAFYRDCLRVADREGQGLLPFNLNAGQKALEDLTDAVQALHREIADTLRAKTGKAVRPDPVRIQILKARRVGFSTAIAARLFHYCEFNSNRNGLVVAHLKENADNITNISRRFFQQFPKEKAAIKIPMKRQATAIEWGELGETLWDSRIVIATANSTNFARGYNFNFVHLSECAFYPNGDAVAAAKSAASFADFIFEESTANGLDPYFYKSWQQALTLDQVRQHWRKHNALPPKWNGKYRFFWSWWQDDSYRVPVTLEQAYEIMDNLDEKEKAGVEKFGWDAEQIEWRRRKLADECSDQSQMSPEDYFCQEYPSEPDEAFIYSGKAVFPQKKLVEMQRLAEKTAPKMHGSLVGFSGPSPIIRESTGAIGDSPYIQWRTPQPKTKYLISVRAAKEIHEKGSVAVFARSGAHLSEVASYRGNIGAVELADLAIYLAELYNMAYIIPEATSPTVAQRVVDRRYPLVYQRKNEESIGSGATAPADSFIPGFKAAKHLVTWLVDNSVDAIQRGNLELRTSWMLHEHIVFANIEGELRAPEGESSMGVILAGLAVFALRSVFYKTEETAADPLEHLSPADRRIAEAIKRKKARDVKRNKRQDLVRRVQQEQAWLRLTR